MLARATVVDRWYAKLMAVGKSMEQHRLESDVGRASILGFGHA